MELYSSEKPTVKKIYKLIKTVKTSDNEREAEFVNLRSGTGFYLDLITIHCKKYPKTITSVRVSTLANEESLMLEAPVFDGKIGQGFVGFHLQTPKEENHGPIDYYWLVIVQKDAKPSPKDYKTSRVFNLNVFF